jgi:uncharacterized protein YfaP (DUF2135 family)
MKSNHTAVVAIVVWYLMIPPIADNKIDAHAPLSTWRKGVSFNSQNECDESLKDAIENPMTPAEYEAAAKATIKARMHPLSKVEMTKRTAESVCVAGDDPRLKGK